MARLAFGDRVVDSAHPLERPSAKSVGLGGGKDFDRLGVELDRALEVAVHVKAHRLVPQFERARARFRIGHDRSDIVPRGPRQAWTEVSARMI